MMPRHRVQTLFIWLMVAVCVLLGWAIQREIKAMPSTRAAAPAADPIAPAASASVEIPGRDSLAVIVDRPVFSESRRPSSSDEGPMPTLDHTLVGVVISDRGRSAIVQPSHGGAVQRLAEGEEVGGWTVIDIAPDHIVVRHDTTEATMPLDYNAPAPPVPVAKTTARNGAKQNGAKPIDAELKGAEAQGIVQDQPPEVLPPPEDDDGDDEQESTY